MSKRSIKLEGKTTSLFLEEAFWKELESRAAEADTSWTKYLRAMIDKAEPSANRSAAIKEALLVQLREERDALLQSEHGAAQSVWLVEENGVRSRYQFYKDLISIGKQQDNDIVVEGQNVDAHHCVLARCGGKWWVFDLNSSQGILLNDKPVQSSKVPRSSEISVGRCQIIKV